MTFVDLLQKFLAKLIHIDLFANLSISLSPGTHQNSSCESRLSKCQTLFTHEKDVNILTFCGVDVCGVLARGQGYSYSSRVCFPSADSRPAVLRETFFPIGFISLSLLCLISLFLSALSGPFRGLKGQLKECVCLWASAPSPRGFISLSSLMLYLSPHQRLGRSVPSIQTSIPHRRRRRESPQAKIAKNWPLEHPFSEEKTLFNVDGFFRCYVIGIISQIGNFICYRESFLFDIQLSYPS